MLQDHGWLHEGPLPILPIPLSSEGEYIKNLKQANPPQTLTEQEKLRNEMGFNYRRGHR
jgi:hypothetical protein